MGLSRLSQVVHALLLSGSLILLLLFLLVTQVPCCFCAGATIRELLASKGNNTNPKVLTIKFNRSEVILDHLELEAKRVENYTFPMENKRQLTIYSLSELKVKNKTRYDFLTGYAKDRIAKRPLTDAKNKEMETKLLDQYDIVMSCQWERRLPPPLDDDQCFDEELEAELKIHSTTLQDKINLMQEFMRGLLMKALGTFGSQELGEGGQGQVGNPQDGDGTTNPTQPPNTTI